MSEDSKVDGASDSDNLGAGTEDYSLPKEYEHLNVYTGVFDYILDKIPNIVRTIREIYHVRKNVLSKKKVDAATSAAKSL